MPTTLDTRTVHAGEKRYRAHDSLTVPVIQTSVYTFDTCAALVEFTEERMFADETLREEYGRYGNPTVRAAEAKLADLEGGQEAILVSSGMAAVAATLLQLLASGDHMILTDNCYHSTLSLCRDFLPRLGIQHTAVPCGDYVALEAAIRPNTRLIFAESPTNPFMRCVDFPRLVDIGRRRQVLTVIDSTFATPINCQPLAYGIDLVIHSVTKYLAGHNDLMAGAIVGRFDLTTRLRKAQGLLGWLVDPHAAYLILRGMKTLGVRMAQHNRNGLAVARFLAAHPAVRCVWYPGLESHPDYQVAQATLHGGGGVVSFELDREVEQTYRFIDSLRIPTIGPSLGGVESLVSPLAVLGYAEVAPEERAALGVNDGLVRLCLGIEDTDDLIADLTQALEQV